MLQKTKSNLSAEAKAPGAQVKALRMTLGETQEIFGQRIGLAKSKVSELENSGRASSAVALQIEALADFTIDAADLSDQVARARSGFVRLLPGAAVIAEAEAMARAAQ